MLILNHGAQSMLNIVNTNFLKAFIKRPVTLESAHSAGDTTDDFMVLFSTSSLYPITLKAANRPMTRVAVGVNQVCC